MQDLLPRLLMLVPLILSLSVHEWAHAASANRLGDDTAKRLGRLTLNPLVHIDPIGTLLLPLLGIPFGWAKPVPVNPLRFRPGVSMGWGMLLTASAGPLSNLALAIGSGVGLGLALRFHLLSSFDGPLPQLLIIAIQLNLSLAVFNLIPIPPLDGSRVVEALVPYRLRPLWQQFLTWSSLFLMAAIVFGGPLLQVPVSFLNGLISDVIRQLAGG